MFSRGWLKFPFTRVESFCKANVCAWWGASSKTTGTMTESLQLIWSKVFLWWEKSHALRFCRKSFFQQAWQPWIWRETPASPMWRWGTWQGVVSSGSEELDAKLWEKMQMEVERGWLLGPLSWDVLTEDSTVSRRFPLEQAGKVRPIDDLSQSQINAAVTCFEQATVNGPDVICAFAVYLMRLEDPLTWRQHIANWPSLKTLPGMHSFQYIRRSARRRSCSGRLHYLLVHELQSMLCARFLQWLAGGNVWWSQSLAILTTSFPSLLLAWRTTHKRHCAWCLTYWFGISIAKDQRATSFPRWYRHWEFNLIPLAARMVSYLWAIQPIEYKRLFRCWTMWLRKGN